MNQAPGTAQPGTYVDSEPVSDVMSLDAQQISIDLSDGTESQKGGADEPLEDDDGLERQSSWRAEEQANDCDLSQVNYRSLGGPVAGFQLPNSGGLEAGATASGVANNRGGGGRP